MYSLRPADGRPYHHVYSGFVWKSCSAKIPGAWRGTQKACRQLSLAAPPPEPLPPPSSQACNALVPEKKLRKFVQVDFFSDPPNWSEDTSNLIHEENQITFRANPHHDISKHSPWHHPRCVIEANCTTSFWGPGPMVLSEASAFITGHLLTFFLASLLALFLPSLLTLRLTFFAYLLTFCLAFFLAYLLTFCLTFFAYLLTFCLAFFLAYLLTFFLALALFPAFCLTV